MLVQTDPIRVNCKVKVIGQTSRSQDENIAISVVDAGSDIDLAYCLVCQQLHARVVGSTASGGCTDFSPHDFLNVHRTLSFV